MEDWKRATDLEYVVFTDALEIIDDATVHSFEFKIDNGHLYYREIVD